MKKKARPNVSVWADLASEPRNPHLINEVPYEYTR